MPVDQKQTPFDSPPLTEGYPLDKNERSELERAIEELDRTSAPRDGRSSDATDPTVAAPA